MADKPEDSNKPIDAVKAVIEAQAGDGTRVLKSGVKVRLCPVSSTVARDVLNELKEPVIPMVPDADQGRPLPNPNDPDYLRAMNEFTHKQTTALIDLVAMLGVELVDGFPGTGPWLNRLKGMAHLGHLDLSSYDLDDEFWQEFLYKRYFVTSDEELSELLPELVQGASSEDVEEAKKSIRDHS